MAEIREQIRKNRAEEVSASLDNLISNLKAEGLTVEFGSIGNKTTYAFIYDENDPNVEYVGYTFIKDIKYFNENVGKLKALNQAMARKEILENEE